MLKEQDTDAADDTRQGNRRVRVLIAEDSEVARDTLAEYLQTFPDIEVCGAVDDGAAAVELALKTQPDAVILDLQMPVLGGIEAAGIFRSCLPHTAIIITTVRDHPDLRAASLQGGADAYVAKEDLPRCFPQVLARALRAAALPTRRPEPLPLDVWPPTGPQRAMA